MSVMSVIFSRLTWLESKCTSFTTLSFTIWFKSLDSLVEISVNKVFSQHDNSLIKSNNEMELKMKKENA